MAFILMGLICCLGAAGGENPVNVTPQEIDELLANPGMGWQTFHRFADEDPHLEGLPSTSAYFRFYWKELEPTEGQIDFAKLDRLLARAREAGQKLAFRIMCAGTSRDYLYVPQWLKDKGCRGFEYQYSDQGPRHWVPDMDDPIFQAAHFRLIRELGKRYDGHPDLDLVDIGSVGLWGEWHMSGTGVAMPSKETCLAIIEAYVQTFPRTPKVMLIGDEEGLSWAVRQGCGWRADCLGDLGGFSKTWNHMEHFYRQQVERTGAGEAWRSAPVAFESCWDMRKWCQEGWDLRFIFDYALDLHASYLNNKSAPLPAGARPEIERFLRKMGYRLVLRKIQHHPTVFAGVAFPVTMIWENVGVAPPYRDNRLAFRLREKDTGETVVLVTETSIRGWPPGRTELTETLQWPAPLSPGRYELALAVVDPTTHEPTVRLAIAGRGEDGWYPLSQVEVPTASVFPREDWLEATPESQGIDSAGLKAAVDHLDDRLREYGGAGTLAIVRNGFLIWKGPDSDQEYQIFSATKSFTSTVLGLLIDDGKVTLETLAKDYEPSLAEQYDGVTLRHFATMTSGYDAAPVHYEIDSEGRGDSWLPDPPAPPIFPPGTRFRYWDEAMMQFGNVLVKVAGEPLDQLFKRRIADPIGMKKWTWIPGNWTGGITTTSRELARFGTFFLNRGRWREQQLISTSWVDQATSVQVPTSIPNDTVPRSRGSGIYGLNWWVNGIQPNGQRLWPAAPPRTFFANGLHANVCIVVPEWNMVIARTNGGRPDGRPNSPENIDAIWNEFFKDLAGARSQGAPEGNPWSRKTEVSIQGEEFYINGRPTYAGRTWQGHKIQGLLFNSRMVQGIFDDLNPTTRSRWAYPDTGQWDAERNTQEFLAAMPEWRRHGLLAFTINLQGGSPEGYSQEQPWHNSAFTTEGELRPDYLDRLKRILDRADELGMVVILGIFYFGQDQRLKDEAAVLRALDNAVDWIQACDYRNVLIEINNECNVRYDHAILQPARVHELIQRVQARGTGGRRLLVSTSYGGGTVPGENLVRSADFLLLHGNGVHDPERLAEMVRQTRQVPGYRPMPILVNEDDHFDFDRPRNNMLAAIGEYCSWGYFDPGRNNYEEGYQSPPVNWGLNTERKQAFFAKAKEITGE